MRRREAVAIPRDFDFATLAGLRREAREKLALLRPATLGAAGRIAGINPPDVSLLSVHLERQRGARLEVDDPGGEDGARDGE